MRTTKSQTTIGPIGIDFSLETLHLVQLQQTRGKNPEVLARASLDFGCSRSEILENPLQFQALLKRALAADRFSGRKCIIAVPSGMFRTMSINYRAGSGKEQEDAAIIKVMQNRVDGDLSEYVLDYLPVNNRAKGDERLALVAVSEQKPIIAFLELARKAGLNVLALEIGPAAVTRLVSALSMQKDGGNVLVINSGRRASFMTLVSDNELLFDQEVAFGEDVLIQQVVDTLDVSHEMAKDLVLRTGVHSNVSGGAIDLTAEEFGLTETMSEILKPQFLKLVDEIKRVCLYAAAETRGGSVTHVYLLGSIARWPGSDEMLSTLTGTEVQKIPDPLLMFPPTSKKTAARRSAAVAPEIVVATGAALRGLAQHG